MNDQIENVPSAETPHTVELPKDSQGRVLDPKDQPLLTPRGVSHTWSLDYDGWEWRISSWIRDREDTFETADCTLLIAPYDKHGRTIKVGDWVSCRGKDPVEIEKIEGTNLYRKGRAFDGLVWAACTPGASQYLEIVPAPDSLEQLKKDAALDGITYRDKHGLKHDYGDLYRAARLHMIDRAYKLGRESRG